MTDAKGILESLRLRLSVFHYEIVRKAGINHQAYDVLSTLDTSGEEEKGIDK